MPHDEPVTLTIQEMASRSGLSEHTLRYYERVGLLTPIPRDDSSGHRRYTQDCARVVETLACLRGAGMPLEGMRRYLRLHEQGTAAATEQKALFAAHAREVAEEMARMEVRLKYLAGKVAYWEAVEEGDMARARAIGEDNHRLGKTLAGKKEKR